MKTQCPNCKTFFKIDDSKIPDKGAHVTCTRCQTRFEVKKTPPAQRETKKQGIKEIITCPMCSHVNLSTDKCVKCGYVFSQEEKKKLIIKI